MISDLEPNLKVLKTTCYGTFFISLSLIAYLELFPLPDQCDMMFWDQVIIWKRKSKTKQQ